MISIEHLRSAMPNAKAASLKAYLPHLQSAMQEFGINTPVRAAMFIAQLAHESGELRYMEEIASGAAYENRRDLGNTQPGDGKRFKGRGAIQLTGRSNYEKFGRLLGVDLVRNPQLAARPEYSFRIAGLYWQQRGLNALADAGNFREITKRINGGYNGYANRVSHLNKATKAFNAGLNDAVEFARENPVASGGTLGAVVLALAVTWLVFR